MKSDRAVSHDAGKSNKLKNVNINKKFSLQRKSCIVSLYERYLLAVVYLTVVCQGSAAPSCSGGGYISIQIKSSSAKEQVTAAITASCAVTSLRVNLNVAMICTSHIKTFFLWLSARLWLLSSGLRDSFMFLFCIVMNCSTRYIY